MSFNIKEIKENLGKYKADAIIEEISLTAVRFEGSKLKSIDVSQTSGIGVRVFSKGRVGFSASNSKNNIHEVFEKANQLAEFGEEVDILLPKNPHKFLELEIFDRHLESVDPSDMISIGESIIDDIKRIDTRIDVNLTLTKQFIEKSILNSSGLDVSFSKTIWGIEAEGVFVDKNESLVWLYDSKYGTRYFVDYSSIVEHFNNLFQNTFSTVKIETGRYPVIFSPEAMHTLIEILLISFNGENVLKGISPVGDKIEKQVLSEKIEIVEDPHMDQGIESQPFDDEGVITNYKKIVESGIAKSFIYDMRTAYLSNTITTGNGFRSFNSMPKPDFSNVILISGENSLNSMISSLEKGVIVYNLLGSGMSNVNAGEFSVNIEMGFFIEKGKIKGRIKDTMMSGNVFEVLNKVVSLSSEFKTVHNITSPYVLCDDVSISAK